MKRLLLGTAILACLLAGGLLSNRAMAGIHEPIAADLRRAGAAALAEDWDAAQDLLQRAADRWAHFHRITAAFADHTPMDEADGLFRQLQIYARTRENPHFSALCAHLQECIRAIRDAHRLIWPNLLLRRC